MGTLSVHVYKEHIPSPKSTKKKDDSTPKVSTNWVTWSPGREWRVQGLRGSVYKSRSITAAHNFARRLQTRAHSSCARGAQLYTAFADHGTFKLCARTTLHSFIFALFALFLTHRLNKDFSYGAGFPLFGCGRKSIAVSLGGELVGSSFGLKPFGL